MVEEINAIEILGYLPKRKQLKISRTINNFNSHGWEFSKTGEYHQDNDTYYLWGWKTYKRIVIQTNSVDRQIYVTIYNDN